MSFFFGVDDEHLSVPPGARLMSLTERERRELAELEQRLAEEDPRFAASLSSGDNPNRSTKHVLLGLLTVVIGLVALVVSMTFSIALVGVVALLIITAGIAWTVLLGFKADGPTSRSLRKYFGRRNNG
ncbi:DUF3040 domain-containing protein [Arthrobacter monumenti]